MNLSTVEILTERLLLKPIDMSYAEEIFTSFDKNVTHYMGPQPADTISETQAFIVYSLKSLQQGTNLQLVIIDKSNGDFFGCAGLHGIGEKDPELGVWLKSSAHGNGYGLEAMTALIEWAQNNIEFDYMTYPVDKRNTASRRIPEKNGGIIAREMKVMNASGFELDEVEYRIYKR